MNSRIPPENDAAMRALLQEWQPRCQLPPRFQEDVWRRIAHAEARSSWASRINQVLTMWLTDRLPRPASAIVYVAFLLVVGAGAGLSEARQETARVHDILGARYAQAVDPYQLLP